MKSLTLSGTEPALASMPSLERSLFSWTLTALTASTLIFAIVGWMVSQRANAAELNANGVIQMQVQSANTVTQPGGELG